MMNYELDINKVVNWLLPGPLRSAAMVAWLNALLSPLASLHGQFLLWSGRVRYDARITGQKRSLQFHLNRLFDPINQQIYIEDATGSTLVYMYLENENQPLHLPVFVSGLNSDFVVHAPNDLPPLGKVPEIRAFLDKYKLPTKQYELLFDIIVI